MWNKGRETKLLYNLFKRIKASSDKNEYNQKCYPAAICFYQTYQ